MRADETVGWGCRKVNDRNSVVNRTERYGTSADAGTVRIIGDVRLMLAKPRQKSSRQKSKTNRTPTQPHTGHNCEVRSETPLTTTHRTIRHRAAIGTMLLGCAAPALAHASTTVKGNVAAWVPAAAKIGTASDTQTVDIAVHMALKNPDTLASLVAAVSTPGSAQYGRYLTAAQMAARFAPAAADVTAVQTMLTKAGMTNVTVGPLGAYVSATATVKQLRTTFAVSQGLYRFGSATMRANKEAPQIPSALAGKILFIEGLDDTNTLRQPFHVSATAGAMAAPAAAATATVTPPPVISQDPSPYCDSYYGDLKATLSTKPAPYAKTLPWLNCGYTPTQIQQAYGLNPGNVGINGAGVTVAIVDAFASPTLKADANRYAGNHGLPALTTTNFKQIIPAGIYNVPASQVTNAYGWWTEQALDIAAVHGSAPGANIVFVGAKNNSAPLTTALMDTIYDHRADIITDSFGDNGEAVSASDLAAEDQAFMAAAVEGITVLFSSGDDGDLSQINGVATGSYEATSPYVTGVGGTSLLLQNASGAKLEFGWGTYRDYLNDVTVNSALSITTSGLATTTVDGTTYSDFSFYSGSGGGISLIEPQPAYQASVVPATLATSLNEAAGETVTLSPKRVSPDIAADADPYTGYLYPETYTIAGNSSDTGCTKLSATTEYCEIAEGGTSLASPLTAGMIATVDQVRGALGKPLVGFANPFLYGLKTGATTNSAAINQITPPTTPYAVLRGYIALPTEARVVTINSVPKLAITTPFALDVCTTKICEGLDDVFNYVTPGYNDVTGLGVPFVPLLAIQ